MQVLRAWIEVAEIARRLVNAGYSVAIAGSTGSGKSTVIGLVQESSIAEGVVVVQGWHPQLYRIQADEVCLIELWPDMRDRIPRQMRGSVIVIDLDRCTLPRVWGKKLHEIFTVLMEQGFEREEAFSLVERIFDSGLDRWRERN